MQYFEAGVHIKNPIKNSYEDGLGRTTQTLDHVVVVHKLIRDKRKSQSNEYSDTCICVCVGFQLCNQCKFYFYTMLLHPPEYLLYFFLRLMYES